MRCLEYVSSSKTVPRCTWNTYEDHHNSVPGIDPQRGLSGVDLYHAVPGIDTHHGVPGVDAQHGLPGVDATMLYLE